MLLFRFWHLLVSHDAVKSGTNCLFFTLDAPRYTRQIRTISIWLWWLSVFIFYFDCKNIMGVMEFAENWKSDSNYGIFCNGFGWDGLCWGLSFVQDLQTIQTFFT